jgi:hypothetical protein
LSRWSLTSDLFPIYNWSSDPFPIYNWVILEMTRWSKLLLFCNFFSGVFALYNQNLSVPFVKGVNGIGCVLFFSSVFYEIMWGKRLRRCFRYSGPNNPLHAQHEKSLKRSYNVISCVGAPNTSIQLFQLTFCQESGLVTLFQYRMFWIWHMISAIYDVVSESISNFNYILIACWYWYTYNSGCHT